MGSDPKEEKEVAVIKSGKYFGELALLEKKPRLATVKAKDKCHFAVIEGSQFQEVFTEIE